MEIKERIGTLIGVLKSSIEPRFEEEAKAIDELESIAIHASQEFEDKNILEVNLIPSKYEDMSVLGIYIDSKINKVFLKSANIDIDFTILNK